MKTTFRFMTYGIEVGCVPETVDEAARLTSFALNAGAEARRISCVMTKGTGGVEPVASIELRVWLPLRRDSLPHPGRGPKRVTKIERGSK